MLYLHCLAILALGLPNHMPESAILSTLYLACAWLASKSNPKP